MKYSQAFILISSLVALTVVSGLAAINLSKAQNELKLSVLEKDGWNAMNACYSAQNVALLKIKNEGTTSAQNIEVDLKDDSNVQKLQANPLFSIQSGSSPNYLLISTKCFGSLENVEITTTTYVNKDTKKVEYWEY